MTEHHIASLVRLGGAALLLTASAVIVFGLRIGGVVATLSPTHGIHSGDVLGVVTAAAALLLALPSVSRMGLPRPGEPRRRALVRS